MSRSSTSGGSRESLGHDVAHAGRKRLADHASLPQLDESTGLGEMADQLVHEERVARRLGVDEPGQLLGQALLGQTRVAHEEVVHRADIETDELAPIDAAHAGEVAQHLVELVAPFGFRVAIRHDEQQAFEIGDAHEVTEQQQRRRRGPLQVVEDQHDRLAPRARAQPVGDRLEHLIALGLGIGADRRLDVGDPRAQDRQQAGVSSPACAPSRLANTSSGVLATK